MVITDEMVAAAVNAYDRERCRGMNYEKCGMSSGNKASIAPMIRAAIEAALALADDPLVPIGQLQGKVPLVCYFASREDADEFAAVVRDAFENPIEFRLP